MSEPPNEIVPSELSGFTPGHRVLASVRRRWVRRHQPVGEQSSDQPVGQPPDQPDSALVGRRPARSGSRRLRWAGTIAIVLLLLVIGADRGAAWYARSRVTSEITQGLENGGIPDVTPTVRIEGIPFLDQVIRGRYDGVKVTARGVSTGGLTASRVDIEATGVRWPLDELADGNTAAIRADRVTAELVVPVSELTTALGPRGVTFAVEGDRLRITAPFEFAGIRGTVSGLADAVVIGGSLRVQFSDLSAVGQTLPQSIADALARQLSTVLDVPRLPYGLRLESVRVTSEGLVAAASGRDVALVR